MLFSFHHLTADGGKAVWGQILGWFKVQLSQDGAPRTSVRCLLSEFSFVKEALAEGYVFMLCRFLLLPYPAQVSQGSGPPANTQWTSQV